MLFDLRKYRKYGTVYMYVSLYQNLHTKGVFDYEQNQGFFL